MTTAEAARLLLGWDELLLLTHVRPDGDTVGSAAALCQALRDRGKTAYLLPNPELTATYAPYAAPYAAPEGFVPRYVVSVETATYSGRAISGVSGVIRVTMLYTISPQAADPASRQVSRAKNSWEG